MDSRDSSSSSPMAVSRDAGSVVDDESVLSLAKEAAVLFQSRKYAECVDLLVQLHQKKEEDLKILHNIALAKYFRDGCSNIRGLIEELTNVKNKSRDLAYASGEQLEAGSQPSNKTVSGPKGTNSAGHQISETSAALLFTGEFDSSVATLNMAIISYHLHDYPRAMSILEPLFQNIEPIDEGTALHVCLLLLDLAVGSQDAATFAELRVKYTSVHFLLTDEDFVMEPQKDVISYVEKAFGVGHMNQTDNGSSGLQTSNLAMKSTSIPVNASTVDDINADASASANASEGSLSRTLSDESAEYETLLSTLDMGGQNLSRLTNLPSANDLPRIPSDQLSSIDLKLKLPLYKVQLLFLTRRLKMAKRELKLAMNIARGRDSSSALLLKSQLELARGNYVKAEKLLKACYNQADMGSSIIYNNNVGCIFYLWGKPNVAGWFFRKALATCSSVRKEKPRELATISQDKSQLIMYNSGLQYLDCEKPALAAKCFQNTALVFYSKPLLWLRFAECCILALEKGLCASFDHMLHGPEFKVFVIGEGKWRQLSVEDGLMRKRHMSSTEMEGSSLVSDTLPHNLSLVFARQCLWNALELNRSTMLKSVKSNLPLKPTTEDNEASEAAPSKNTNPKHLDVGDSKGSKDMLSSSQGNTNGDIKEQKSGSNNVNAAPSAFSEYEDARKRENLKIKQAILVDLAFVELELGNPLAALSKARSLLEMPECYKICAFLARVYAAEALCLLNKPEEAAEQLSVYFSSGNIDLPYGKEELEQWQVNRPLDPEESHLGSAAARNSAAEEVHSTVFYKPEDARGALYVNLASMSAMQGDFDRASQLAVRALSVTPRSKEANLMCVYVDLKLGKLQEARARLRSCNRVSFVRWGSRSKGPS